MDHCSVSDLMGLWFELVSRLHISKNIGFKEAGYKRDEEELVNTDYPNISRDTNNFCKSRRNVPGWWTQWLGGLFNNFLEDLRTMSHCLLEMGGREYWININCITEVSVS